MKLHKNVIMIVIFAFFLAGCGGGPGEVQVYQGTEAIHVETARNAPPDEVFEGSTFMLSAQIQNRGAYSLEDTGALDDSKTGYLTVTYNNLYLNMVEFGVDEDDMRQFNLQGRSISYPQGERDIINLGRFEVSELSGGLGQPKTDIRIDACYPYETQLLQTVCIDTSSLEGETNPICQNRGSYQFSGQGAPIVVRNVDVSMIPEGIQRSPRPRANTPFGSDQDFNEQYQIKPRFEIEFENRGDGRVMLREHPRSIKDQCRTYRGDKVNRINIEAYLGVNKLVCQNDGEVRFSGGKGEIICELDGVSTITRNEERQLYINASYIYTSEITKTLDIVRR